MQTKRFVCVCIQVCFDTHAHTQTDRQTDIVYSQAKFTPTDEIVQVDRGSVMWWIEFFSLNTLLPWWASQTPTKEGTAGVKGLLPFIKRVFQEIIIDDILLFST